MNKLALLLIVILLSSCELVVLGNKKQPKEVIDITQETSTGAALLFVTELQQENVPGAAQLLADVNNRYDAKNQSEQYYNLSRFTRILKERKVSRIVTDTLSLEVHNVKIEYDYVKEMSFSMRILDSLWYVVDFQQIK